MTQHFSGTSDRHTEMTSVVGRTLLVTPPILLRPYRCVGGSAFACPSCCCDV